MDHEDKHTIASMRTRLADRGGDDRLWQTLEEFDHPDKLRQWAADEFGKNPAEWPEEASRRQFLQLMGASLVMAGAAGCTDGPADEVVPYVDQPEQVVPGNAQYYATAFLVDGFANGVLAESHAGRPTKIEGNPQHPTSRGSADAFAQASIWGLYDPDRARAIRHRSADGGRLEQSWAEFSAVIRSRMRAEGGAGVGVLTETVTSPTLAAQLEDLRADYPQLHWHHWSPINRDNARAGTEQAFGRRLHPRYHFDRADVVLAVDSDFLHRGPGRIVYARDWARKRRARQPTPSMSRMYAVEATFTVTGSKADNRLQLRPERIETFLRLVARQLGVTTAATPITATTDERTWAAQITADLRRRHGHSVVVPGIQQPPAVHALAHAINVQLDAVGATVEYTEPVSARPDSDLQSLKRLTEALGAGDIDTLIMVGGNPAYNAPADLQFDSLLKNVDLTVHLSNYVDETSRLCDWQIPRVHSLEAWSDGRANDGTTTILQPLIEPLYGGHSAHELVDVLAGNLRDGHSIVRDYWRRRVGLGQFPRMWRQSLHDGVVADTRLDAQPVSLRSNFDQPSNTDQTSDELSVIFAPDPSVHDGRFSNVGMLQELPKPLTSVTWDNTALMSPRTAERLDVDTEQVVRLSYRGGHIDTPVWVMPGHADGCVTLRLGYGKEAGGRLARGLGVDTYKLRTSSALWFDTGLTVEKLDRTYPLAATQSHHRMHGREIVRHATIDEFRTHPAVPRTDDDTLYPEYDYDSYAWAMNIDQTICTGCQACVAACQVENNVPIVGKEQVRTAREMHWLRVDTYYVGPADDPRAFHQPVPCMQCEKAPCELVCPVEATAHDSEGINQMTYNRCIGTRYCSNNCPYKVRRFNWLDYNPEPDSQLEAVIDLKYNPDVSVRSRGVMEKCTYCIQRINEARIDAKIRNERIQDDQLETACQQACPTDAIIFGDQNDPRSRVSRRKEQPHDYNLLDELNTQPRTTYLSAISNPNVDLSK